MQFNRVWAIGRDTYLRAYPNPGCGLCLGRYRAALSWYGGLELFKWRGRQWVRVWSLLSRVKRPGSK